MDMLVRTARRRFQVRRAELLLRLLAPKTRARILDLGGGSGYLSGLIHSYRPDLRFTIADPEETRFEAARLHGFDTVSLPHDGPLPFQRGEFDIVLCNSVIEHVTLPKQRCLEETIPENAWRKESFARQKQFAAEISRIGRSYFVQTPHRSFPFDVHLWLPFTAWLPHELARRLVPITDRLWIKKCGVADWHLLDEQDLGSLFPDGHITVEKFMGLPKSVIAWR